MKIDFKQTMKTLDGEDLKAEDKRTVITLQQVATQALLNMSEKDPDAQNGEQKAKRYELAMKIFNDTEELSIDEAKLLKDLIGRYFNPIVVGQAWKMLES